MFPMKTQNMKAGSAGQGKDNYERGRTNLRVCFNCQQPGHNAAYCPQSMDKQQPLGDKRRAYDGTIQQPSIKKQKGPYKPWPPLGTGPPLPAASVPQADDKQEGEKLKEEYLAYLASTAQLNQPDEFSVFTEQEVRDDYE